MLCKLIYILWLPFIRHFSDSMRIWQIIILWIVISKIIAILSTKRKILEALLISKNTALIFSFCVSTWNPRNFKLLKILTNNRLRKRSFYIQCIKWPSFFFIQLKLISIFLLVLLKSSIERHSFILLFLFHFPCNWHLIYR